MASAKSTIRIEGDSSSLRNAVNQAQRDMERFRQQSQRAVSATDATLKSVTAGVGRLAAVIGSAIAIDKVVGQLSEFDRLNASLKTVTGSLEEAGAASQMLRKFAAETPYELSEVTDAFIRLKSLGLDTSVETLRSFGNTAAAMGKPMMQFIEAVADATTGEFERLKEFGIKASQEGDSVALTFQGVTTTIGKSAGEIQNYLLGLGNTKFASGMEDQMRTLGGGISNLKDAFANLVDALGNLGVRGALMRGFAGATDFLNEFRAQVEQVTGEGLDAQIGAYERRISESAKVLDQLRSVRAAVPIGGQLLVSDTDLRQREQTLLDMNKQLVEMRKNRAALASAAPSSAATAGDMGPTRQQYEASLSLQKESTKELHKFEVERRIAQAREAGDVKALTALYAEQLQLRNDSKLTTADRQAMASMMAADSVSKSSRKAVATSQKEVNQLMEEGRRIAEQYRSPQEEIAAQQEKLSAMLDAGAISAETYRRAMAGIVSQYDLMGPSSEQFRNNLENLAAEAERVKSIQDPWRDWSNEVGRLNAMVEEGFLSQGEAQMEAARGYEEVRKSIEETGKSAAENVDAGREFAMTMTSAISGAITHWQGFGNLLKSIGEDVAQLILKINVLNPLEKAMSSSFSGGSFWGALTKAFGFADGGIMTSAGPMTLRTYAGGGIANRPQLAMFGEGSRPEAFVPLPDGRRIPVDLGGGGSGSVVQIIDQRSGGDRQVQTSRGADGQEITRIIIRDEIRNAIASGYLDKSLATNYGVKRPGVTR